MNFLPELAAPPFVLGLMAVVLAILAVGIGRRLARAAELAADTLGDDASLLESRSEEDEMAVVDLRSSPATASLRRSFARVEQLLRRLFPGRKSRYQVPWFLTLGPAASGKTTLLRHSRQVLPAGAPGSVDGTMTAGCNWWVFDRAVVLDLEGEIVLEANGAGSDQVAWRGFLRLLRNTRPLRAADAIVLVLSAGELLSFDLDDPEAQDTAAERASILRRKLRWAQHQVGMRLPIYVVVAKCDHVAGFRSFTESLASEERRQIFGWSNPDPPEAAYTPGWIDTAFKSVRNAICGFQMRVLGGAEPGAERRAFVAFPVALGELEEPLRIYLNQIFAAGADYEPFPFRGLYFCGGRGFDAGAVDSPHTLVENAAEPDWETSYPADDAHRRVDFLADLFEHKIFYEWNLATPTRSALRAGRRRTWIAQTLLFAAVLLGPLVLWSGLRLSSSRAATVDQELLVPVLETVPGDSAERTLRALDAAGQVPDYRLSSTLLPWGGRADQRLAQAVDRLYRDTVFPVTRQTLDRELTRLAEEGESRLPATTEILDVESTPEFPGLQKRTGRLTELERDVARFNCFSPQPCTVASSGPGEVFRQLISSLYDRDLRFPTRAARDFYDQVLGDVRVDAYTPAGHRADLRRGVEASASSMFRHLFDDNVLRRGLDDLAGEIDRLARQPPAAGAGTAAYQRLLDSIDGAEATLSKPRLAWAGRRQLELGGAFDEWLRTVFGSELLGRETAAAIRREGDLEFARFRERLAATTAAVGPLLAAGEDGDVELRLSTEVEGLRSAVRSLLDQPFMEPALGLPATFEPPPDQALFWRPDVLEEAAGLVTSYDSFFKEQPAGLGALAPPARDAARASLEGRVLDKVALAQELRETPDLFTNALRENHVLEQVANLQSVSAALNDLLDALPAPPATALSGDCSGYCTSRSASGWCQLSAILEIQQRNLLDEIDRLLAAEELYTPRGGNFEWWDGTGDLALAAFDVPSADDLATYLAGQQRQAKTLARQYAGPVLTSVHTKDCWGFSSQPGFRRFKVMLSDLSDLEGQKPENAIARLEGFIASTLPEISLENCLTEVPAEAACFATTTGVDLKLTPPCDFFLEARNRLAEGIRGRCDEITVAAAAAAWEEIARSFENRLQGKFPFVAEASRPNRQQATAADVDNFLRVYDRQRARIESFLAVADRRSTERPPPWNGDQVNAVRHFVAATNDVRELFTPFLAARAESASAVPVFDVQVQFRVNRGREVGGNQILGWSFEVGDERIQPGDVDPPGRWVYGQITRLTLTWAADALTEPLDPAETNARQVEKRVVYEHDNAWALVSLLKQYAASAKDFPESVDPDPVTLVFDVPTRCVSGNFDPATRSCVPAVASGEEPAGEADPKADFTTRVFVRVTLMTPDRKKVELPFPVFPTEVPPFPDRS